MISSLRTALVNDSETSKRFVLLTFQPRLKQSLPINWKMGFSENSVAIVRSDLNWPINSLHIKQFSVLNTSYFAIFYQNDENKSIRHKQFFKLLWLSNKTRLPFVDELVSSWQTNQCSCCQMSDFNKATQNMCVKRCNMQCFSTCFRPNWRKPNINNKLSKRNYYRKTSRNG